MSQLMIKQVSKKYSNGTLALSDISFEVEQGEFISIIGRSGAGKSSLLRCINRMIDVSQGDIIFNGQSTSHLKGKNLRILRTQIGMIFQHYNLVERLSVIENVLHGRLGHKSTIEGLMGLFTKEEKKQAFKIIEMLGLEKQVYNRCDQLSGGQKQRVGIARALAQNPKLLLCDEPIASLDPNSSTIIMDHLKSISKEMNITCLVNLHQVQVALKYSDRIIGIHSGKVVYDDNKDIDTEKINEIYGSHIELDNR
ncbi:phosphonate ABC transporter ATP-binding protein [Paenibacillus periandrae]|uniref:phosphonate ABC transporter ATP-binding protein n=1 Tax=Paenibacillus periandrae TaxID=1761741 RepID=UPI001F08D137|nr:phosphonate ABC transporter ATP-binding protein [Paenibacillus periandrae]